MGAILAILGEAGDPELSERLQRMIDRSPYRGTPELLVEGPLAIGIQSMGWDASLADDGNWLVAFHGYIGNWAELAAERGWRFPDWTSNAGKVAVAVEDLGDRLFARLRGEWALLIWDRREHTLLAARDLIGCRPLFTHRQGSRLFLATEIRQVLAGSGAEARCHPGAAADLHLVRFPESGRTLFQGVQRLRGGMARMYHADGSRPEPRDVDLWSPPPEDRRQRDTDDLIEEVRGLLDTAVKRATPERGAGVSLSGGMDSSSVWGTLVGQVGRAELGSGTFRPYSNVYPGLPCDESVYIRLILESTGVEGELVDTAAAKASEYLETLCDRIDHPHMPNALPVELVCEAVAANGHSVLLTGLGGDEWLGGSLDYIRGLFYSGRVITAICDLWGVRLPSRSGGIRRRLAWLSPQVGLAARVGWSGASKGPRHDVISAEHRRNTAPIRGSWRERVEDEGLSRSKMILVGYLDHLASGSILDFIEQQGAWHGVEVRHPLMDMDIVEFGFSVEPRALIGGRCHKWLMRQSVADRLPAAITERIETTGFSCLFEREQGLLKRAPSGRDWSLAQLGVVDADAIDRHLSGAYSQRVILELIRLWWLEVFVSRNFASGRHAGLIEGD